MLIVWTKCFQICFYVKHIVCSHVCTHIHMHACTHTHSPCACYFNITNRAAVNISDVPKGGLLKFELPVKTMSPLPPPSSRRVERKWKHEESPAGVQSTPWAPPLPLDKGDSASPRCNAFVDHFLQIHRPLHLYFSWCSQAFSEVCLKDPAFLR